MYDAYGLFIGGAWRPAQDGATLDVFSPVSEQSLGQVPAAGVADTEAALSAAKDGFGAWSRTPAITRADTLHAIADEMIRRTEDAKRIISLETGKPLVQAEREWSLSVDQFRWYAEEARRIYGRIIESRMPGGQMEIHQPPVGVVAAFTAWNFPAVLVARKVAPALAAGCSVVVRPSSQTPGSAMIIFECMTKVGLPDGAVGLVIGSTSHTYGPLMQSKLVRKVSLTGSTRVGQQMIRDAADTVKKLSMELGGNAPCIVYDDADLTTALDTLVPTKFANCGQVCVTPDRFYVHESLHDDFVEGFVARTKKLVLGDGMQDGVTMGPLINARRLEEIEAVVADARAKGAKIESGGQRSPDFNAGHFFEPTVISNASDDMKAVAEENFGPIAAIMSFASEDEAIARANSTDMGLASYAWTASPDRARRTIKGLHAGMVGINSPGLAASEAPFGGTNFSGMGREGGLEGIRDYLDTKLAQVVF